jgi:hypothetical protein
MLRLPHFPDSRLKYCEVVSRLTGCALLPGRFLILVSVSGWVDLRTIVWQERLGQLKNWTCDLPVYSRVPQPTVLPCASLKLLQLAKLLNKVIGMVHIFVLLFVLFTASTVPLMLQTLFVFIVKGTGALKMQKTMLNFVRCYWCNNKVRWPEESIMYLSLCGFWKKKMLDEAHDMHYRNLLNMCKQTPWPESTSEIYQPLLVDEDSGNFCRYRGVM